jgi:Flp pilus assembly protein TadG
MRISHVRIRKGKQPRRGAAAVELAVLLPVLVFWSMATVDYARLAYAQVALQNCARNGALYEFYGKSGFALPSGWTSLATAVQADEGSGLTVTATATSPASTTNNYVTVTATATFSPIAFPSLHGLPSIPGTVTLTQSVSMPFPASASPLP